MINIKNSWSTMPESFLDDAIKFQSWFDCSGSEHQAYANGIIDFYHRILTPDVLSLLGDPRDKKSFEIGFGGGRLMNAALNTFSECVGIDITTLDVRNYVKSNLDSRHGDRTKLYHRDECHMIDDNSIDFVYSFIVIQHFDSFDEVKFYVQLIKRILKSKGIGRLFFMSGQQTMINIDSFKTNNRAETLIINPQDMFNILNENSMKIIQFSHAGQKCIWDVSRGQSSQHFITFVKE